jgi:abequosyltransferase
MTERPRISLSIPTYNRVAYLKGALESALREMASLPEGVVEVLVCDNASTDGTEEFINHCRIEHPELKYFRNPQNLGFDLNYLRCIEEARGEFVWVMGDDDLWRIGSVARVLREIDAGAEACLCLSVGCDQEMNPVVVLPWYLDPDPPKVWELRDREDLIRYFDACAYNAAVFATISVAIIPRDRFMDHKESCLRVARLDFSSTHIWGMMECFKESIRLHYIPETLVENRLTSSSGDLDLYGRWMHDLKIWPQIADGLFLDDPEVNVAFSKIVGRNHHNTVMQGMRLHAGTEERWNAARPYLLRAGFTPVMIDAVNLCYQYYYGDHLPSPCLDPVMLCLADFHLVARGAQRIAVLLMGDMNDLLEGTALLAALRRDGRADHVQVYCSAEFLDLLDGFQVRELDAGRYIRDVFYRESMAKVIKAFEPELVLNFDRARNIVSDDLVAAAHPVAALAYEYQAPLEDEKRARKAKQYYPCLLSKDAGLKEVFDAVAMNVCNAEVWPSAASMEEAKTLFDGQGWESEKTLAVLVDDPRLPQDARFRTALMEAGGSGWNLIGLGERNAFRVLDECLQPWEGRAINLAGSLSLGSTAAVLQRCAGYLGGVAGLQGLALASGCKAYPFGK